MEKVVPYFILYNFIFYLKFLDVCRVTTFRAPNMKTYHSQPSHLVVSTFP
jgi:hypothetical protein